jgi:enoyl-CoA hydratase/carnithine racemase
MEVVEELDLGLAPLVAGLLAASPATVRATKEQLLARSRALDVPPEGDEQRLAAVYAGPDFTEGVRAFLAKEHPSFTDATP